MSNCECTCHAEYTVTIYTKDPSSIPAWYLKMMNESFRCSRCSHTVAPAEIEYKLPKGD